MEMRLHVLKIATRFNMYLPKGLLHDSNRCLAELKQEACGGPDLLQTWAEYSSNHWGKTSLWSMIRTAEVLFQMAVSKRLGKVGSACQGFFEDMPSAMCQVSAHDPDIWSEGLFET